MVFDKKTRQEIRDWLNKVPACEDLSKARNFLDINNEGVLLTRCTTYLPGGAWKFRSAHTRKGYPVAHGAPIKSGMEHPKEGMKGQAPPTSFWDDMIPAPVLKSKKNPGAFKAAVQAELNALKKTTQAQLNQPWDWWVDIPKGDPTDDGKITFQVQKSSKGGYTLEPEDHTGGDVGGGK